MQAQAQYFYARKFIGISLLAAGLGILAHYGGQMWATEPTAPVAAPVAQVAQSSQYEVGQTLTVPSEIGDITLRITGISADGITLADAEGDEDTVSLADLVAGIFFPADEADRNAARMAEVVEQRRQSGYYERNAPAGWCNATDCPPVLTVQRQVQPAAVSWANAPSVDYNGPGSQVGGNYVPEHWPAEIRAALQYPSGYNAQKWAQENLP